VRRLSTVFQADPTVGRLISFLSFDFHKDNSRRMEGFMVINFADKAVIGIAAVPMMQELQLGPRQFGLVGSSFFLLFAVSSVATGFLVKADALGAAGDGLSSGR
jgi:hypothetical protein